MAPQDETISTAQQQPAHAKKLQELQRAKDLADAEKARLEAETGRLKAQKALDTEKSANVTDEIKAKVAAATSEKQLADAEKARIDAQRALEQAKSPPDRAAETFQAKTKAEKERAEAQKATSDAQKAEADASKAKSEAEVAAFKARFGEVPTSAYKGEITLRDNAGKPEAFLLATHAMRKVASIIAAQVQSKAREVMLISSADIPKFDSLIRFRAEIGIVRKAFDASDAVSRDAREQEAVGAAKRPDIVEPAEAPKGKSAAAPLMTTAGLTIEAVDKLLGFFRSDYAVGGVDVTLEDAALINELAGQLTEEHVTVYLPKLFDATLLESSASVISEVEALALRRVDSASTAAVHERLSAGWTERAAHEANDQKKKRMAAAAETHQHAAKELLTSAALYDSWFARLSSSDEKLAAVPIVAVIREQTIINALTNGRSLLVAHIHASGGSYYTKKNIWTVFGGMPFFHMGGTVASFALLHGPTGAVLAAGTVPVHGGFVKATRLASEIGTRPGPS
ncbi:MULTISPECIES: hypothetical protein [unclassified Bradyrhizobium]|uniref:hypothetical protein n=1 Tax=unclassified Bradyrhizobium TaxID=2631580 RepID=UPI0029164EFE|nr:MULTISPECIES: hypothetical protein [unclassified Bradyrhizobium]